MIRTQQADTLLEIGRQKRQQVTFWKEPEMYEIQDSEQKKIKSQ